jgi:hypothetical protein
MPKAWSDKRERQYQHIKDGLRARGKTEKTAEEIAGRTVNKERAQHGEARTASPSSVNDLPAPVRGGQRSHQGEGGRTLAQLRQEASRKKLPGRSGMNKAELERALTRR